MGIRTWAGLGIGLGVTAGCATTQPTGVPIAETLAALRSTNPAFTEKTFFALCRVAFHEYPQPLKNYQFDEEISELE
jgi:hypothetical protein